MEELLVKELFDRAANASRNVRSLQVTMATCCIVAFLGLYNSFQYGWIQNRVRIHGNQMKYLSYIEKDTGSCTAPLELTKTPAIFEEYTNAKKYYQDHFYTPEILHQHYVNLLKSKNDNVLLVKIPFFNTAFDINDLAIISGFGFSLILFISLYALHMKKNQVNVIADYIKSKDDTTFKKLAYSLLLTNQILMVNVNNIQSFRIIRRLPAVIYWMPFSLFFLIFGHDMLTYEKAKAISLPGVIVSYIISAVFLFTLLILTMLIINTSTQLSIIWKDVETENKKLINQ